MRSRRQAIKNHAGLPPNAGTLVDTAGNVSIEGTGTKPSLSKHPADRDRAIAPEPDQSRARLVIVSDVDSAEELAAAVGLPPDEAWNRGEPKKTRGLRHTYSGVEYCSRLARSARPEEHLDDLLARLVPVEDRIARLSARLTGQGGRHDLARLTVSLMTSNGTPGFDFSSRQLTLLSELGVWFGLSLYVYDDVDAEADGC